MPRREDDFDKALSDFAPEQEAGVGNVVIFFLVSVFCAVLPGYLFTTPLIGMDLMENMPVYAGVTAISGLLLTFASTRVADGLFRAAKQKAKGGKGSEQLEKVNKSIQAINEKFLEFQDLIKKKDKEIGDLKDVKYLSTQLYNVNNQLD